MKLATNFKTVSHMDEPGRCVITEKHFCRALRDTANSRLAKQLPGFHYVNCGAYDKYVNDCGECVELLPILFNSDGGGNGKTI
jgi:hypothetical protein